MIKSLRLATAFLLLSITVNVYSLDNMNRQIGIIYLKNAAVYYLSEQYDEAERLLEKTSEFQDDSSDYEYLYGMIRLDRENRINEAAENFKKAIKNNNWILFNKKECVTDLARIMFRKKQYTELIDIIENESFPDYNDNDMMYTYLLSLKYDAQMEKYRSLLKRSIERYSDDYRFAMLYVHEDRGYCKRAAAGLYDFSSEEGRMKVILEAAMTLESGGERLQALESYIHSGGKDVGAMIEYYRLRGGISNSELQKLIEGDFFSEPANRGRLESILTVLKQREMLEQAYSVYTGNIYYDFNDDGYYEELHLYENGKPVGLSIDENQDGIIEVMLIFDRREPQEIIISGDVFTRITYDNYPAVREISISNGSNRDVYTLLRDKLTLPAYELREQDAKLVFLKENIAQLISNTEYLSEISVSVSTYTGGDKKDNYGYLEKELERTDEYYSILRIYNKIIGNYVYQQVNDKRTMGYADLDYDNLIDLRESYSNGELISIEADDNKNGIYDYMITFEGDAEVSWWDFNEDGIYDCRQYRENGVLINEYSSGFNGTFDIIERK